MNRKSKIWLASYPRSGNTFLRTILWHCFALRSSSIYPNDLGGNKVLENYVGHIERHGWRRLLIRPKTDLQICKTHAYPADENPAIYAIRDGRAATVSLWRYFRGTETLDAVIEGQTRFGTWSDHVRAWTPYKRPNTLMLKYEDIRNDLPGTLGKISTFLNREILHQTIPDRNTIASTDGIWVKQQSDWRTEISALQLNRFNQLNKSMLRKTGYDK